MPRIEHITSPSNPKIKAISSLFLRKYRKETGLFIAEGLRSVLEGIDCGAIPEQLIFSENAELHDGLQRAIDATSARGGLCLKVGESVLEKLSRKENPQMVMGVFKQKFGKLSDIDPKNSKCWVALEEVRDPGNLGTIMRTIDGVGADGVILIGQCCDAFSVECVRATMGSVFSVPVIPCSREDFLDLTVTWEGAVIATALNDRTVDFREADYKKPLILVMGNEQAGITDKIQSAVHQTVKLPMNGRADSLNLSIATGIMLYAAMEPWEKIEKTLNFPFVYMRLPVYKRGMSQRIEVITVAEDGRAKVLESSLARMGKTAKVKIIDTYTIEDDLASNDDLNALSKSFVNPVTQKLLRRGDEGDFDWALEIGYLPGVTDNIGHTVSELASLTLNDNQPVYSSQVFLFKGDLKESDIKQIAASLYNPLIQRADIKPIATYKKDGGMDVVVPKVKLDNNGPSIDNIDLNVGDDELMAISKDGIKNADGTRRGPLGMSLLYMKAVQEYFKKQGRPAKDIEIEMIAQSWSEHCKHTIFASPIDDIKDGLYKHYIKRATQKIRKARGKDDICVSVFKDNSGAITFDDNWLITDKVETHNSPSALDPFGGAITGIVGVNRDCMGFGKGAKPALNRYGFCLADPNTSPEFYRGKGKQNKMLSPATVMKGVIHGVNHGGNCSGISTPQGFIYFDDRYAGKPLVFAGTVGIIPRTINNKPSHEKAAQVGDYIVMAGGKVGRDGIHGATFSSVALDEGSPATAVQIGDPITQKKMSDALIKDIRDLGLYNAITDNGAGGLSSSVGEMGQDTGGFDIDLETVPLKYPGMQPWEIWISESQERMTLAVPPQNWEKLHHILQRRGVESWVIGTFTNSGKAVVKWYNEPIMDMDMEFIHDGVPKTPLKTTFTRGGEDEPNLAEPKDYRSVMLSMLSRLNICSKEFVATQYDHNVQGSAVLGPLQGPGRVFAYATVSRPVLTSPKGAVLSQGLMPRYSDIDTYDMAAASLDMAVRAAVAAGCPIDHLAILDNFCWCSSEDAERLGQLKRACEAIYDLAVTYQTPFISGKDSMFNDFKGYDANDNAIKISIPPTLLVSGIGVMEDINQSISLEPKMAGDLVYVIGITHNELGASEYYAMHNVLGNNAPKTDGKANLNIYKAYSKAAKNHWIASSLSVTLGGVGVALAKKCIAGGLGMDLHLLSSHRLDTYLFSESVGRMIVTIDPANKKHFEELFGDDAHYLGVVTDKPELMFDGIHIAITDLEDAYKKPLKDF